MRQGATGGQDVEGRIGKRFRLRKTYGDRKAARDRIDGTDAKRLCWRRLEACCDCATVGSRERMRGREKDGGHEGKRGVCDGTTSGRRELFIGKIRGS